MATQTKNEVTTEFLDGFANAWCNHDVEELMSYMSNDPLFQLSAGPDIDGKRFEGWNDVKAGFQMVLDMFPDGQWIDGSHFIAGDRGVSEWTFTATGQDGNPIEVRGCDLFAFKDGKISVKNSFRKTRTT
ncbi:MAG: nuclear transport factor 2 family protein [SAR202 cluster bacterium]|jgi:ketosteroid isomerase-like protein|nr:nuclear transport factor 2 family protein [SAR202 cluster bacterium]